MVDQSIALMGLTPQINAGDALQAVQRLQQAQEMLTQTRQTTASGGADLDEKLMRQAVAEAGDDPQAWGPAMQKAAAQGSRTAAANTQYSPLAAQRLGQAYG